MRYLINLYTGLKHFFLQKMMSCIHVAGKLRYKGPLQGKDGTYFGVELINARGKGNSNGSINNQRFEKVSVKVINVM